MSVFIISQRSNGQYYFNLKADNGEVILSSEGYTSKTGCINGIAAVKSNARDDARFDRKVSSNGKYYFNLKALNGQVIGVSELYNSNFSRERGVNAVKQAALTAITSDKSA